MKKNKKMKIRKEQIIAMLFLLIMVTIWLVPLAFGIFTSFKSEAEIKSVGFALFPKEWTLNSYIKALQNTTSAPLVRWFMNSLVYSVSHTVLVLLVVSLTAFGYSRLSFRFRDTLFFLIFTISMFPDVVSLIPKYKIVDTLGWVDTIFACIIPGLGGVGNVFLVRQFMFGIPKEYDESAYMDGAGSFTVYWKVILPLVKPVMTVVALFSFTGIWNDFLWPSIVFNNVDHMTITIGLELMKNLYGDFMYLGQLMAGAVIALIPTFVLFLSAQKYFLQSMSLSSGVKG